MNLRKTLLLLSVLGVAIAALLYSIVPRGGSRTDETTAGNSGPSERASSGNSKASPAGSGVARPAPSEDEIAGGRDGKFTTAPPREPGALTDPQPEIPFLTTGEKAGAWVTAGGRTSEPLNPNQFGEFPRVHIQPSQEVSVRVAFPEAEAGTRVVAQVEDGGKFADGKAVAVIALDEKHEATFQFTAGAEQGAYRICVRNGPDWKYIQLWAATDPSLSINR